jgi:hypothetical protein
MFVGAYASFRFLCVMVMTIPGKIVYFDVAQNRGLALA